jgi:hypothetical protein
MSEQRLEDDAAPVDAGAPPAVPIAPSEPAAELGPVNGADEFEQALAEFDQSIPKPAPAATEPEYAAPEPAVDAGLAARQDLLRQASENLGLDPTAGPTELERQVWIASEKKFFDEYATSVQEKLPDFLPSDYAKRWMLSEAATDPSLRLAWDYRDVNPAQARAELFQAQRLLTQMQMNPVANPAQIAELQQYAEQLNVACNARTILRRAELRLLDEAKKSKRPVDREATEDRAVVWAVRGGQAATHVPEEPIDWGQLSDQEFRAEKRKLGLGD